MATVLKSKLAGKMLGNPKAGALLKDGERHYVGRIFGVANGVKKGTNQTGDPYLGLRGSFEGRPADTENYDTVQSGVCYLPGGIAEMIAAAIESLPEDASPNVQFAFDLYTKKANNPIGYEWDTVPVIETKEADPLSAMRTAIEAADKAKAAQIEDKSKSNVKGAK